MQACSLPSPPHKSHTSVCGSYLHCDEGRRHTQPHVLGNGRPLHTCKARDRCVGTAFHIITEPAEKQVFWFCNMACKPPHIDYAMSAEDPYPFYMQNALELLLELLVLT